MTYKLYTMIWLITIRSLLTQMIGPWVHLVFLLAHCQACVVKSLVLPVWIVSILSTASTLQFRGSAHN